MPRKFYEKENDAYHGLMDALPKGDERPLSTMQIWHKIERPKPSYGVARYWLKEMVADGVAENIGCGHGAQFYRMRPYEQWPD